LTLEVEENPKTVYSFVQVANGDEKVRDWNAWFAEQIKREEEIQ